MKTVKAKGLNSKNMWCYFSPDGYPQLRSITFTKKDTRRYITRLETTTWQEYEDKGYYLGRVDVNINPIKP